MPSLDQLFRMARMALTPGSTLKRKIGNNVWVTGENREGHGIRAVYLHGESCEGGLTLLKEFLSPGETFLDIGANIGIYTVLGGEIVGRNGCVIAIEPFVKTAARLQENVLINGLDQVKVRVSAMGTEPGHAKLHMNLDRPVSFSLVDSGKGQGAVDVPIDSIDDLVSREGIAQVHFIKMDVEGFEHEVLKGGFKTIQRDKPIIQFECYDDSKFEDVLAGYRYYRFLDVAGNPHDVNVLALHESSPKLATADRLTTKLKPV